MVEKLRHSDKREHRSTVFEPTMDDPTLVVCPKCNKLGKVFPASQQPSLGYSMKFICTNCSFSNEKTTTERCFYWNDEDPSDSYFQYPLWLKRSCCGHSLWVFNKRHLEFLEGYVGAELRERKKNESGWANSSLASRLPKWIKIAKNRIKIMAGLKKVRELGGF